ncbi:efflux RND transporter permease subunit, partial [Aequoribacter sp.]|uniref:efflux RND transporter permease subunit n=1 Tax=Aequoribacter sp. TaxID=2847771 RepID=UPI003F6A4B5C
MNSIITWFIHNRVAANLLMMILIAGGTLALPQLYLEEFPEVEVDAVSIRIPYLGAAPQEVESAVCIRVEEALEGTEGVDTVRSTAAEGMCSILAELVEGVDRTKVANDIRSKVDAIDSFPAETERPITSEITVTANVLHLVVYGDTTELGLQALTQTIRDDIAALPGVSQVDMNFNRDFEISIEVPEQNLRQFDLTLEQIGQTVRASSLDLPGGSLDTPSGEILVRTQGQAYRGQEFEDIIVKADRDGRRVNIAEIAKVRDAFVDADMSARFNGAQTMSIMVSRVGKEDTIQIADAVKAYLGELEPTLPEGMHVQIWKDESADLTDRLEVLVKNARSGLVLVLIVLALFLQFRLALWVAAGIPIALLGTLAVFPGLNIAISTMSIMAFILVIGILVDDAIVVGERIFAHEEMGKPRLQAAVDGTTEVSTPVIFGVLTTMATFIPIMNIPGELGGFFLVIGAVVIIALFFSIFESQLILPHHLAHRRMAQPREEKNAWQKFQTRLSDALDNFAVNKFKPMVRLSIEYRYSTLAVGIAVLTIALGALLSGRILFQFFPAVESTRIYASVVMPEGTPIETTQSVIQRLEDSAQQLKEELDAIPLVEGQDSFSKVYTAVGTKLPKGSIEVGIPVQTNIGEVGIHLNLPSDYKGTPVSVYANRWRELTGTIPDLVEMKISASSFSIGAAIDIELLGRDFIELQSVAEELKAVLASYPGVVDI